jgi:hypothetical protein
MAKDCLHLEFDSISNRCSNCNRLDTEINKHRFSFGFTGFSPKPKLNDTMISNIHKAHQVLLVIK